jgi:TatD DNase family protein
MGLTIGVGGVTTFKNAEVIAVLKNIGLDHVVLETDSPYLAPTPHRGKRNESAYLKLVATHIADNLNMTLEEVDAITTANARRIFQP